VNPNPVALEPGSLAVQVYKLLCGSIARQQNRLRARIFGI
jgi:hypothetical protein